MVFYETFSLSVGWTSKKHRIVFFSAKRIKKFVSGGYFVEKVLKQPWISIVFCDTAKKLELYLHKGD